jgi:hypothetical protein
MDTQEQRDQHEPAVASEMHSYVGIDVSKARLDVAVRPSGEAWQSPNDEAGIAALVDRLRSVEPRAPTLIVLEATGGLERLVVAALALAGLPVAVVNPRQVRDFGNGAPGEDGCGGCAGTRALRSGSAAHTTSTAR